MVEKFLRDELKFKKKQFLHVNFNLLLAYKYNLKDNTVYSANV